MFKSQNQAPSKTIRSTSIMLDAGDLDSIGELSETEVATRVIGGDLC